MYGDNPNSGFGINPQGFINTKSKISQSWLLSVHLDSIMKLKSNPMFIDAANSAVRALHSFTVHIQDDKYRAAILVAKRKVENLANQYFPLKNNGFMLKSQRAKFIENTICDEVFRELMILLQRRNILPAKSIKDVDVDLDLTVNRSDFGEVE